MIFEFLKKQKEIKDKINLIKIIINSLKIPEKQKELFLEAINIIDNSKLDSLYNDIIKYTKNYEITKLENINKQNFTNIEGIKKKEAIEKQKELNAFTFLLHNI